MSKLFNPFGRRARGVIADATLASLALAGALAASAPASAGTATYCAWQPLSLMNGWQSDQNTYGTGDPAYCVTAAGMVYLSGSLTQATAGGQEFAQLPAQAAPASMSYLSVYTFDGATGVVRIDTSGRMYAYNGQSGSGATQYTSLAGISFPVASVPLANLNLFNGWQSAQSQWGTGDPSYFVYDGVTHLAGSLNGTQITPGLGDEARAFALPGNGPPSAPGWCTSTEVYTYGGVPGTLELDPAGGEMKAYAQGGAVYNTPSAWFTSLAGVAFPKFGDPNWQWLTLINGWSQVPGHCNAENQAPPMYDIVDGVVYLAGTLGQVSPNGNGEFAVLPAEARPAHNLYLTVNAEAGPHASLEITPSGAMYLFGGDAASFTSLAGLSYQVSS